MVTIMDIEYVDKSTGGWGSCRQFRLLQWPSFIGQFVHSVGEEGMGKCGWMRGIVILAC